MKKNLYTLKPARQRRNILLKKKCLVALALREILLYFAPSELHISQPIAPLQVGRIVMELRVNGKPYSVNCDPSEMLVWVLRDDFGLTGTKMGCGAGICGACTIHISGVPVRSCITPVSAAMGLEITTIEGLATIQPDGSEKLHALQQAFIDEQVPQCAWCISGQIMTAAAFLKENPHPKPEDIDTALENNYCRCGCYVRIRAAVELAAKELETSA